MLKKIPFIIKNSEKKWRKLKDDEIESSLVKLISFADVHTYR